MLSKPMVGVAVFHLTLAMVPLRHASAQCDPAPITFSESAFTGWSLVQRLGDNPGSAAGAPVGADGSPAAPCYGSSISLSTTPGMATSIISCHSGPGTTYSPAASGAIATVDWQLMYRWVAGSCCAGQAYNLIAIQDGIVFAADYFLTLEDGRWFSHAASGLTPANFARLPFQPAGAAHPDFTQAGTPIQFGIATGNTTASTGTGYSTQTRLDTWTLRVHPARCVADTDDGTGTGTCDGGVTIDDLLYFLGIFEAGVIAADVDDGSGTGTPDGGITIDDLLYYLARFEAGC